ncbi:MAG: GNAT family N-acetyltransferase [Planctomycetes bacterium]|nr:GNAT family N-acetyltransferase [Planctomycetota bacterium]
MTVTIRQIEEADYPTIAGIVSDLPEWFDVTAREHSIPVDIGHPCGVVAVADGNTVGFVTGYVADGRLNIGWQGVRRDWHRRGVGGLLLARVEKLAVELGNPEVVTYTLGEGVDYPPYEATRQFYCKHGFEVYQRNRTDNPSCPEEIRLRKTLQ